MFVNKGHNQYLWKVHYEKRDLTVHVCDDIIEGYHHISDHKFLALLSK